MIPGGKGSRYVGREGFSLLEVMAAVAVLSIALVALLQAQGRSLRTSHDIQLKSQAILLAREKMTELELRPGLDTGEDEGEFEDVPPFRWETIVVDRQDIPELPWLVFREITVKILWPGGVDEDGHLIDKVYAVTQFLTNSSGTPNADNLIPGGGDVEGGS